VSRAELERGCDRRPNIVGIGGTTKVNSSTQLALAIALDSARSLGAQMTLFGGEFLMSLPMYACERPTRTTAQLTLIDAVRKADGVIIASPSFHGGVSALVKNAIDLLEDTAQDARPYLDGVPVGLIVTAYGSQAIGTTLAALRSIVHALRGWPTPLGGSLLCAGGVFNPDGSCKDAAATRQLNAVGRQAVQFGRWQAFAADDSNARTSGAQGTDC
jgi:FMN reductase